MASPLSFEVKNDGFCYRRKRISAYKLLAGGRATLLRDDEDTLSKKEALLERCRLSFANHFGDSNGDRMCAAVAPARVNLIGEHVDYCDGFVLPMVSSAVAFIFELRNISASSKSQLAFLDSLDCWL